MKRKFMVLFLLFIFLIQGCQNPPLFSDKISPSYLKDLMESICNTIGPREIGSKNEEKMISFIEKKFTLFGYQPKIEEYVTNQSIPFKNISIVKERKAESSNKNIVAIVAHYDTKTPWQDDPTTSGVGAIDNTSGIAVLIELARALSLESLVLDAEVRMIAVGAEEVGYQGSKAYVNSLTEEEKKNHIGVFVLDIVSSSIGEDTTIAASSLGGRGETTYQKGSILSPVDNAITKVIREMALRMNLIRTTSPSDYWLPRNYGYSDHVPFHEKEIDAANFGWRKKRKSLNQYPSMSDLPDVYHTIQDNLEKFDYQKLTISAKLIFESVIELSNSSEKYLLKP